MNGTQPTSISPFTSPHTTIFNLTAFEKKRQLTSRRNHLDRDYQRSALSLNTMREPQHNNTQNIQPSRPVIIRMYKMLAERVLLQIIVISSTHVKKCRYHKTLIFRLLIKFLHKWETHSSMLAAMFFCLLVRRMICLSRELHDR